MKTKEKVIPTVVEELTLNDYSPSQFRDKLNEKYKGKTTGKPFTAQDIHQYIKRGSLPTGYVEKILIISFKGKTHVRIKI